MTSPLRFIPAAVALMLGAAALLAPAAAAQTAFVYQRTLSPEGAYTPGGSVDSTVSLLLNTSEQVTAAGFEETLPHGWTYDGVTDGAAPTIVPASGKTGLLDFARFPVPAFPTSFTYRAQVPAGASGDVLLRGQGIIRTVESGELRTALVADLIDGPGAPPPDSADTTPDNVITLSELLRVIQFFNSGGLSCAENPETTEYGYQPGFAGGIFCAPHASDYQPQDWVVRLSELLRLVQFFNFGGYTACPQTLSEDGYCPGAPAN